MNTGDDTSSQATAATTDAPTETPVESQVDTTSTAATTDGEETDYLALLDQHGSKLDDVGGIDSVDLNAEVSKEKPAAKTKAAAAPEVEENAEPTDEPTDEEVLDDPANTDPNAGTPAKKDANQFRLNLKDATDKDRKTALVRLLKAEPGIDLEEAARRVGIKSPAATEAKPNPAKGDADTTDADPHQALRDEVAQLRKDADAASETEFDPIKARKLDRQADAKQAELDRLDNQTNQEKARKDAVTQQDAQKQFNSDLSDSWQSVFSLYPDAQKAGSDANKALQEAINAKHKASPKFFDNPDWPSLLALPTFAKRGLAPSSSAATAPVVPAKSNAAPAVTAKKTSTPVPPAPAPGATGGGTPAGWNENSGEDIFSFLERTGTKLTPTGR